MKHGELQINDWVLLNGEPIQIKSLTRKKIGYHRKYIDNDGNVRTIMCHLAYSRIGMLEPIELTDDILVKFGFEHNGFGIYRYAYNNICSISYYDSTNNSYILCIDVSCYGTVPEDPTVEHNMLKTVNEFQNVLRTAKLFNLADNIQL